MQLGSEMGMKMWAEVGRWRRGDTVDQENREQRRDGLPGARLRRLCVSSCAARLMTWESKVQRLCAWAVASSSWMVVTRCRE